MHACDDTAVPVLEVEGTGAGLVQFSEQLEPDYMHAGIDRTFTVAS